MTLIHTALMCEAQPIIEYFKLKPFQKQPYKIYQNENIILVVSGIGKEKTIGCLDDIIKQYKFNKAINVGIAGCKDKMVEIGSFYKIEDKTFLTTVDSPLDDLDKLDTLLVDMEAKYFVDIVKSVVSMENIDIFKIVSDHLDKAIPKKSFVTMLIKDNLGKWCGDLL